MANLDSGAMTAALFSQKKHNDGIRNKLQTVYKQKYIILSPNIVKAFFNLQFSNPKRHKAVLGVPVQGTVM